jgi:PIN domain-containing protein
MAAASGKSGKRSGGKGSSAKPPPDYRTTLYLDENLCDCAKILEVLRNASFPFERHLAHFPRGTLDEDWLSLPGRRGWAVLTKDKAQRYSPLEKAKIIEHKLKIFAFSSGNLSGAEMADLLQINLGKLDRFANKYPAPFVGSITKTGINLRTL